MNARIASKSKGSHSASRRLKGIISIRPAGQFEFYTFAFHSSAFSSLFGHCPSTTSHRIPLNHSMKNFRLKPGFNAKAQRCEGARVLEVFVQLFNRHPSVPAGCFPVSRRNYFVFFAPSHLCDFALNSTAWLRTAAKLPLALRTGLRLSSAPDFWPAATRFT
jgi:hypothetical protein